MYHTGNFIFTGSIRWNCWTVFFVKLPSFSKEHNVFWLAFFPHEGAVFQRNLCTLTQILRGGWRTEAYWPGDFSKEAFRNLLPFVFATLTNWHKGQNNRPPQIFSALPSIVFSGIVSEQSGYRFVFRVAGGHMPCSCPLEHHRSSPVAPATVITRGQSRAERGGREANACLPH